MGLCLRVWSWSNSRIRLPSGVMPTITKVMLLPIPGRLSTLRSVATKGMFFSVQNFLTAVARSLLLLSRVRNSVSSKLSQDFLFVLFLQRTAVGSEDSMIFFKSFDGECIVADNSQFIQYFAQLGCMPPA